MLEVWLQRDRNGQGGPIAFERDFLGIGVDDRRRRPIFGLFLFASFRVILVGRIIFSQG